MVRVSLYAWCVETYVNSSAEKLGGGYWANVKRNGKWGQFSPNSILDMGRYNLRKSECTRNLGLGLSCVFSHPHQCL